MYEIKMHEGKRKSYQIINIVTKEHYRIDAKTYNSLLLADHGALAEVWESKDAVQGKAAQLKKRKVKRDENKKHAMKIALDTETVGFDGEILTTQFLINHPAFEREPHIYISETGEGCVRDAFNHMNNAVKENESTIKEVIMYIHNAAFDLARLAHALPGVKLESVMAGSTHIMSKLWYDGVMYQVIDTYRMLPNSLEKLAQSFAPHLPKMAIDLYDGFDIESTTHIEYAKRDVEALMAVLEGYAAEIGKPLERLKPTVAGEAFDKMMGMIFNDKGKQIKNIRGAAKDVNLYFQNHAYTGGRIYIKEGTRLDQEYEVVSYDITSSYPYEMWRQTFPLGVYPKVSKTCLPNNVGRYFVRISVRGYNPKKIPILPYRTVDEETGIKESTYYPRGNFETVLADVEYEFFLKHTGGAEWTVHEYLYWYKDECHRYFKHYVEEWKRVKEDGDKLNKIEKGSGDAKRMVGKLMLNSPYGKLAQKYDMNEPVRYINDGGAVRKARAEEIEEFLKVANKGSKHDQRMAYNAAFITAGARINLLKPFYFFGEDSILYCDTDSVKVLKEVHDRVIAEKGNPDFLDFEGSGEFGKWKNEGVYWFIPAAPKVYMLKEETDGVVDYELKSKGFPSSGIHQLTVGGRVYKSPDINSKADAKKWEKKCLGYIYEGLLKGERVVAVYGKKPTAFKTALMSRDKIAWCPTRDLYDPVQTAAYDYDEETNSYRIKHVDDAQGLRSYSYWCRFYKEREAEKQL